MDGHNLQTLPGSLQRFLLAEVLLLLFISFTL